MCALYGCSWLLTDSFIWSNELIKSSHPNPQTQTDKPRPLLCDDTRTESSPCCPERKTIQGRRFSWTGFSLTAAVNKTETGNYTQTVLRLSELHRRPPRHTFLTHLSFWVLWDLTLQHSNQTTQFDAVVQLLHEAFGCHLLTYKNTEIYVSNDLRTTQ